METGWVMISFTEEKKKNPLNKPFSTLESCYEDSASVLILSLQQSGG